MLPDNHKKHRKESGSGKSPQRFQPKVLIIYLVILAGVLTLWFANSSAKAGVKQLTINELVQLVESGALQQGAGFMEPDTSYGRDGYVITGQMPKADFSAENVQTSESQTTRFTARGRLTEADFLTVREVFSEKRTSTGMQDVLISILPFILIIGLLYFLFVRQLKNAGRGAMSFGKSKGPKC